jgi:hypothetical protein
MFPFRRFLCCDKSDWSNGEGSRRLVLPAAEETSKMVQCGHQHTYFIRYADVRVNKSKFLTLILSEKQKVLIRTIVDIMQGTCDIFR